MIIESRSYRLHPGKLPEYLAGFAAGEGVLELLAPHLRGFWFSESGELNRVHHLWRYESRQARAAARAQLAANPLMGRFFAKVTPLLEHQHSQVMTGDLAEGNPARSGGVYDRIILRAAPLAAGAERLADQLGAALERHFEIVAKLKARTFEGAGSLREALFVVRSASLDERDQRWSGASGALSDIRHDGAIAALEGQLMLPAAFSRWR
ncbi:MAG: hypothetical protein JWQ07_1062 [Ramlibacter sp.]|nr:hypothetical protein [Ramlibacter sp.]